MSRQKLEISKIPEFIFGGKAIFTLYNERTGIRFTYKIKIAKSKYTQDSRHYVSVLRGANNESDYTYVGCIKSKFRYEHSHLSKIGKDAKSIYNLEWLLRRIQKNDLHLFPYVSVWHEGKCCVCGRKLTVPESIASGIGPECAANRNKISKLNKKQLSINL